MTSPDPRGLASWVRASGWLENDALLGELTWARRCEQAFAAAGLDRRRELPRRTDPFDLGKAGWGIVLPADRGGRVRQCLLPLIDRRRQQAGNRFQELWYQPGDLGRDFLEKRNRVAPGTIDSTRLPYYLLLVGGPDEIPFEFQYHLNVSHAVGRLGFEELAEYGCYARSVVDAERRQVDRSRTATLFMVENGDAGTRALARHLVQPLAERATRWAPGWKIDLRSGTRASKSDLVRLLVGPKTPTFLLTAGHGRSWPPGSPEQEAYQGALVCQDWSRQEPSTPAQYLHAGDIGPTVRLPGLMAFLTACHGVGTPVLDNFPDDADKGERKPRAIAPRPFLARLPQALLSHGALAVMGHVDRGWTLSYSWPLGDGHYQEAVRTLEDTLEQLFGGERVGHAMRPLYRRFCSLAAQLSEIVDRQRYGVKVDEERFSLLWTAYGDARNLLLLGDPAVCLTARRTTAKRGWRR